MANQSSRRIVTFELSPEAFKSLDDDAAVRGLGSLHQRAREVVIDYLSNQTLEELSERITALEAEIANVVELLRRVAFSVITHAAGRTSDEANEWIRDNMPNAKRE